MVCLGVISHLFMSLTDSGLYEGFCLHESMGVIVMQFISMSI